MYTWDISIVCQMLNVILLGRCWNQKHSIKHFILLTLTRFSYFEFLSKLFSFSFSFFFSFLFFFFSSFSPFFSASQWVFGAFLGSGSPRWGRFICQMLLFSQRERRDYSSVFNFFICQMLNILYAKCYHMYHMDYTVQVIN